MKSRRIPKSVECMRGVPLQDFPFGFDCRCDYRTRRLDGRAGPRHLVGCAPAGGVVLCGSRGVPEVSSADGPGPARPTRTMVVLGAIKSLMFAMVVDRVARSRTL